MKLRVKKVIDGDSFDAEVTIASNENEHTTYESLQLRCRIGNVDAPERGQAHHLESKQFLRELIEGKKLTVQLLEKDRYNRYVVVPYLNEQRLDEYLVQRGIAWHFERHSGNPHLVELEQHAIFEQAGIWSKEVMENHFSRYSRTKGLSM